MLEVVSHAERGVSCASMRAPLFGLARKNESVPRGTVRKLGAFNRKHLVTRDPSSAVRGQRRSNDDWQLVFSHFANVPSGPAEGAIRLSVPVLVAFARGRQSISAACVRISTPCRETGLSPRLLSQH